MTCKQRTIRRAFLGIGRESRVSLPRLMRTSAVVILALFGMTATIPAAAHPADEILERDFVHVHADSIEIETVISAGIIKLYKVWDDADTDGSAQMTEAKRDQFGQFLTAGYDATLDGTKLPVTYVSGSLKIAATRDEFARQGAGPEGAIVTAVFRLPLDPARTHTLRLSVNHYNAYASGSDGTARVPGLYPDASTGVGVTAQGQTADYDLQLAIAPPGTRLAITSPALPAVPAPPLRSPNMGRVTWLTDLLRAPSRGPGYAIAGMLVAVALGALHALTPGHGKTMVAAYLAGGRGRVRDAVVLGGAVTLTHTGSVILLGVITLLFAHFILPERVIPWLEMVSGVGILVLGGALLMRRLRALPPRRARIAASPARVLAGINTTGAATGGNGNDASGWHSHPDDGIEHTHGFLGVHTHAHTHGTDSFNNINTERLSFRSLVLMGMSGGLVPCPDALAILLVAVAVGRVLLGLAVILCFSLGLAAVLIGLGILIASTRALERGPLRRASNSRHARYIPAISAAIVVLIGAVAMEQAIISIAAIR